jgi:TonB family protein
MKKIILASLLALSLSATASAALPTEGVYLGKDGTPLTAEQQVPPSLKTYKLPPQNAAVSQALAALPHSTATLVKFSVNEDGAVVNPTVMESSGSVILDQYATETVELWQFKPAKRGDRAVSAEVSVPLRFVSTMVAVPAHANSEVLKDMPDNVSEISERNGHPVLQVKVYVDAEGTLDGRPEVLPAEGISSADFKVLVRYVEASVKSWDFTPALNPDNEPIGADTVLEIQL